MSEFVINLEVNESLAGKALVEIRSNGYMKFTHYVSWHQMNEIFWHSQHVHEEHPDWSPLQVITMAMKIVLLKSDKSANKMNEYGTN